MKNWLTDELAQDIVDKMMLDIPYSINIMNEKGIIIGSGNKERIGTFHQGAVKALESGSIVEIFIENCYEKKGTNEPIVINGQFVGVVGITGEPDEVRPFCKLVKTTVTLLIEQNIVIGIREAEKKRKEVFLEVLINETKDYSQELIKEAEHYHINLHLEATVVLIKNLEETKESSALLDLFPSFKRKTFSIVILQNLEDVEKLIDRLVKIDHQCIVAAGNHLLNVASSYHQAYLCLKISERLDLRERVFFYKTFQFLAELSQTDIFQKESLNLPDILLQTLKNYIHHNGNPTKTAQALMIHRNTLYYRLDRIKQFTGKDPTHLLDLFELIYLLLQQ